MKKILLFLLLGLFMINIVSAAEFDNVGQYNETTKTITIKNSILGIEWLSLDEVGGAQLNTPQNYVVPVGYQKVAEFDLWAYEDYNDVLKNLEFYDKNYEDWDKHKFTRDFDIKYKTITLVNEPIYNLSCVEDICENITIGYEDIEVENWIKVTPADLKKNDRLTMGIFTEVEKDDYVEWIISIYGVEVTEWATFEESSNATGGGNAGPYTTKTGDIITVSKIINLTSVIKFSGSTPTKVYVQTAYGSGIIDSATFSGNNATFSSPITLSTGIEYYILFDNSGSNYQQDYKENVGNSFPTSLGITTMIKGVNQIGNNDTKWYRNLDSLWLRTTAEALVVLNSPEDNAVINDPLVNFNWTLSPSGSNITNWTLNVFYTNGSLQHQHINTSININESVDVIHNDTLFLDESYIWNVEACQLDNTCFIADNQTFTLDTAPPVINITYPPEGFVINAPQENITLNYTVIHPVGDLNNCFFNTTSNSTPININCTLNTTSFLYPATNPNNLTIFVFGNDTAGNLGSDSVTIYKDTTSPQINITAPTGIFDYTFIDNNETLNWTVTDDGLDTCWYNYNGTNITINCSLNTTNFIIDHIIQNITFYANDTFSNTNSSFTSWGYTILEINQTFDSQTTETTSETFDIWIQFNISGWDSISANFNYDGINYSTIQGGSGETLQFVSTLDIPSINVSEINNSFHWIFILTNSTGTKTINSQTKTQTVTEIMVEICDPGETPYIIFDTRNAENPFPSLNATFKSAWTLATAGAEVQGGTFAYEDITETNSSWEFCISPNSSNYTISTDIEIDATGFSKSFYYIENGVYKANQTQNISLYLLNDSLATPTILEVKDRYQVPITEALIFIQLYDIGTDIFYTVSMGKTDLNGKDTVYLNWFDSLYKFVITADGETIYTEEPRKIYETPTKFNVEDDITYDFDKFQDFEYSLFYNNITQNFVLTYVKPSALVEQGCLRVTRRTATQDTTICSTCSSSASATLYCNIASAGNGTFLATFYATGSLAVIDWISQPIGIGISETIFNLLDKGDAAFYTFLLTGIVMTAFLVNIVLGIIGLILGLLAASVLGFTVIEYSTFLIISVVGGIIIWIIKR